MLLMLLHHSQLWTQNNLFKLSLVKRYIGTCAERIVNPVSANSIFRTAASMRKIMLTII